MPKNAVGRNDPCPCGSGKKYKKCCLVKDESEPAPPPPAAISPGKSLAEPRKENLEGGWNRIEEVSNGAVDAIKSKRYEEAEKLCEQLLRDYPEIMDGHDRLAMLRESQGRFDEAAAHYARALAIMERHRKDYDAEMIDLFEARRQSALARARSKT